MYGLRTLTPALGKEFSPMTFKRMTEPGHQAWDQTFFYSTTKISNDSLLFPDLAIPRSKDDLRVRRLLDFWSSVWMTTVWVHTYYPSPLLYSPTFYGILNITIQEVSTWSGHVYMQDDKRRQESKCVCVITDDGPIQQCYTTSSNNSAIFSTADPSISYTCMIEQHQQMHKPILQLFFKAS